MTTKFVITLFFFCRPIAYPGDHTPSKAHAINFLFKIFHIVTKLHDLRNGHEPIFMSIFRRLEIQCIVSPRTPWPPAFGPKLLQLGRPDSTTRKPGIRSLACYGKCARIGGFALLAVSGILELQSCTVMNSTAAEREMRRPEDCARCLKMSGGQDIR